MNEKNRTHHSLDGKSNAKPEGGDSADRHSLYKKIFDAIPEPVWLYDLETLRFLEVNHAAVQRYGYTREEFLSLTIEDIRPVEDIPILHKSLQQVSDGAFYAGHVRHLTKTGQILQVDITSYGMQYMGKLARVSIARDITDRIADQTALAAVQQQNLRILDAMGEGVHGLDREGKVIFENPAAIAILGWEAGELRGSVGHQHIHHHHSNGREYLLQECPIHNTLADGKVRRVEEDWFFRKDGSGFPVEYVCTPVLDEKEAVQGVVVVFRDVSQQRLAARLQALETRLLEAVSLGKPIGEIIEASARGMAEVIPDALSSIHLLDEEGLRIRNAAYAGLPEEYILAIEGKEIGPTAGSCGTAVYRKNMVVVEDIAASPLWEEYREAALKYGLRACWSVPIMLNKSVAATFAVYYKQPRSPREEELEAVQRMAYLMGIALERDRKEKELQESEARFRRIFLHAATGIAVISPSNRFLQVNMPYCAMLGYTEKEMLQKDLMSITHVDDRETSNKLLQELLAGIKDSYVIEKRYIHKNGSTVWCRSSVSAMREPGGRIVATVRVVEDITEAMLAQQKIERLNRVSDFLSQINKAIVHLRDRQQLFETACGIAVKTGGLYSAWIGLLQEDGFIVPAAEAGELAGYLGEVQMSSLPTDIGNGPMGRAMRERKWMVCSDIANDPSFAPWREQALQRGFRSSAVFPLIVGGRMLGGFSLYADTPNFFNQEETSLLEEVAANLAHALEFLEQEERRHNAETALRISEERFRLLARATNDVVWDWDLATDTIWWTDGWETVLGYSAEEVSAALKQWSSVVHPEDLPRLQQEISPTLEGRAEYWAGEYRVLRRNGTYASVLIRGYAMHDQQGHTVRMIGGMTDVSEYKLTQDLLAEQAALLDAAQEAILVRDMNSHIVYWNKGAERTYGWRAEEVLGSNADNLLKMDGIACQTALDATMEQGEWSGELLQTSKAGQVMNVDCRWTLVRDKEGLPKSILAINNDITERKRLEQQFLRAQRLESIGTLAGGIAHDLNNTLTPILMSVEMLQMAENNEEQLKLLSTIEKSAVRGSEMVKQVLTFARGVEGRRIRVDFAQIIRDIYHIVRDTFPKNIVLHFPPPPRDLWVVEGDSTQLHQVLLNLCVNARDAMQNQGVLSVSVKNSVLDAAYAGLNPDLKPGPYVVLEVEDTGSGISAEVKNQIFDPFFTTKGPGQGTGLGLSTTLAIVRSHGGFINVYSELKKGATFKVYLPAAATDEGHIEQVSVEQTLLPRGNGETILVVDDEENIRDIVRKHLERFGYKVLLAANGAEAVSLYATRKEEIAVVLTDMMMPIMDGPATIVALKALNPAVRIIGSSGLDANGRLAQAAGAGVRYFVPKPYTAEQVLRTLHQIIMQEDDSTL